MLVVAVALGLSARLVRQTESVMAVTAVMVLLLQLQVLRLPALAGVVVAHILQLRGRLTVV